MTAESVLAMCWAASFSSVSMACVWSRMDHGRLFASATFDSSETRQRVDQRVRLCLTATNVKREKDRHLWKRRVFYNLVVGMRRASGRVVDP